MTLVGHPPTAGAAAAAPALAADHPRQGGGTNLTIVTAVPNQTDLEAAAALGGQAAVRLREGAIRTETRLHWEE